MAKSQVNSMSCFLVGQRWNNKVVKLSCGITRQFYGKFTLRIYYDVE